MLFLALPATKRRLYEVLSVWLLDLSEDVEVLVETPGEGGQGGGQGGGGEGGEAGGVCCQCEYLAHFWSGLYSYICYTAG